MTQYRAQIRQLHLQLLDGRQAQAGVKPLVARAARAGVASDRLGTANSRAVLCAVLSTLKSRRWTLHKES